MTGHRAPVAALLALLLAPPAQAVEWRGFVAAEYRGFFQSPADPVQHDDNVSLALEPEIFHKWNNGRDVVAFTPFLRLDQHDEERTHFDIRELTWVTARDNWEFRFGIRKVFWGVAESNHLVDIINQTDLVEDPDAEDKLGQPMLNLALIRDWGTLDLFVLTGFRERTFPGPEGRLRTQPRVDKDLAVYESSAKRGHIDLAGRWSKSIGVWDAGISYFHGTTRQPRFIPATNGAGENVLAPLYEQIDQTGVDVQATLGSWLLKLEALRRSGQGDAFYAAVGGFEYTFYGVLESAADVGLLVEYHYDQRPKAEASVFDNDLFAGMRLTLNDAQSSQLLAGCVFDLDVSTRFCNIEASRRLGSNWVLSAEMRTFNNVSATDPLFSYRRDSYLQLELAYYFQ